MGTISFQLHEIGNTTLTSRLQEGNEQRRHFSLPLQVSSAHGDRSATADVLQLPAHQSDKPLVKSLPFGWIHHGT